MAMGNTALRKRIDTDFETYVSKVLLGLDDNTEEEVGAIVDVISHGDVGIDLLEQFLARQQVVFPSLEGVPAAFHAGLLSRLKIEPTWENCVVYSTSESYEPDVLTRFLNTGTAKVALAQRSVPGDSATSALREYLFENDDLDLDAYRAYVKKLPEQFPAFPAVDASKIRVLIDEHAVTFTAPNFESLEELDLRIAFLAKNFTVFSSAKSNFEIDDDDRAMLLRTGITDAQKLGVINEMGTSYVVAEASVASDIGSVLNRAGVEGGNRDPAFIKAVVAASQPARVQVSLLNRLREGLSDDEALDTLSKLPSPYSDIASHGKSPRIESSDVNSELARWLEERGIISSWSSISFGDEIKINTKKKKN
jgi:hypothetical protein